MVKRLKFHLKMCKNLDCVQRKNPECKRHWISWPVWIVTQIWNPLFFFTLFLHLRQFMARFGTFWRYLKIWTLKKTFLVISESPIICPLPLSSVTKTTATATAPPPANSPNMHSRITEWGDSGLLVKIFSLISSML